MTPPTAEDQLRFLTQIQRIFAEGQFSATYKYALLLALADLSVEYGDDSGCSLALSTRQLAEKFIQYYWKQAAPYFPAGEEASAGVVLLQNTDKQAAHLRRLTEARARYSGSYWKLRQDSVEFKGLLTKTANLIRGMPLTRLQTLGKDRQSFLYEIKNRGGQIDLQTGVAYCFRRFYGLIVDMIRGAWVRYVRCRNSDTLRTATDLPEFLFATERASLLKVQDVLKEVQKDTCFYCKNRISPEPPHVDHFIPWSRYPMDLGHNFVLAHARCNADKGDHLASDEHLVAWADRNFAKRQVLDEAFNLQGVVHDLGTSSRIAHWTYSQIALTGGQTWSRKEDLRPLSPRWEEPFLPLLKIRPTLGL